MQAEKVLWQREKVVVFELYSGNFYLTRYVQRKSTAFETSDRVRVFQGIQMTK
jgi:hypothetical protein